MSLLVLLAAWAVPGRLWPDAAERTPMELVAYTQQRLSDHPWLLALVNPGLALVQRWEQREAPPELPTLGKGQQAYTLPAPLYDLTGRPQPVPAQRAQQTRTRVRVVDSLDALAQALRSAQPGDTLELAPGRYALTAPLGTSSPGTRLAPITLRAAAPARVVLESAVREAIVVAHAFWVVENLELRGVCNAPVECESAIVVQGAGAGAAVLNNRIVDFNSAVRVRAQAGLFPDGGLVQFNTLENRAPRTTAATVSLVEVVGASDWTIVDNRVEPLAKTGGNRIAYGLCIRGGGARVSVQRNLVVCTSENTWQPGARVGISLGCGLTAREACRNDAGCDQEHVEGVVSNNIVAHCNDFGIDLNRVKAVTVSHNTLVNTAGLDVRHESSVVRTYGNLVEGRERARDGAQLQPHGDLVLRRLDGVLSAPLSLDLRWREAPDNLRPTPENDKDFCGMPRPFASPPGATLQSQCVPSP